MRGEKSCWNNGKGARVGAGRSCRGRSGTCPCDLVSLDTQILVWHTRTEKPVLVNEGKKGFTDPTVEI